MTGDRVHPLPRQSTWEPEEERLPLVQGQSAGVPCCLHAHRCQHQPTHDGQVCCLAQRLCTPQLQPFPQALAAPSHRQVVGQQQPQRWKGRARRGKCCCAGRGSPQTNEQPHSGHQSRSAAALGGQGKEEGCGPRCRLRSSSWAGGEQNMAQSMPLAARISSVLASTARAATSPPCWGLPSHVTRAGASAELALHALHAIW